jgi:hypothetical protein
MTPNAASPMPSLHCIQLVSHANECKHLDPVVLSIDHAERRSAAAWICIVNTSQGVHLISSQSTTQRITYHLSGPSPSKSSTESQLRVYSYLDLTRPANISQITYLENPEILFGQIPEIDPLVRFEVESELATIPSRQYSYVYTKDHQGKGRRSAVMIYRFGGNHDKHSVAVV